MEMSQRGKHCVRSYSARVSAGYLENIYPESQMPLDYYSLGEVSKLGSMMGVIGQLSRGLIKQNASWYCTRPVIFCLGWINCVGVPEMSCLEVYAENW